MNHRYPCPVIITSCQGTGTSYLSYCNGCERAHSHRNLRRMSASRRTSPRSGVSCKPFLAPFRGFRLIVVFVFHFPRIRHPPGGVGKMVLSRLRIVVWGFNPSIILGFAYAVGWRICAFSCITGACRFLRLLRFVQFPGSLAKALDAVPHGPAHDLCNSPSYL